MDKFNKKPSFYTSFLFLTEKVKEMTYFQY